MSYTRTDLKAAVLLAAWIIVLLGAGPALAHKVYLFAWVEGDQVMVDAYFSKSRKVVNGSIQVLDPEGRGIAGGKKPTSKAPFLFRFLKKPTCAW